MCEYSLSTPGSRRDAWKRMQNAEAPTIQNSVERGLLSDGSDQKLK
jgi:hypothetical protein